MANRCALITTHQVEAGIRTLSGLIQGAKLPKSVMINLSTGTGLYPEEYPAEIKGQILNVVKDKECDFICFSIVDLFFNRTIDLLKHLKRKTGLPIIVGGIHAELYPEETIGIEGVDAICAGEAYESLISVLLKWGKRFEEEIPDFWFKQEDGSVKKNRLTPLYHGDDFKKVPIPDYSYTNYYLLDGKALKDISSTPRIAPFKVEQHQIGHNGSIIFSTMTGCSSRCSFCNITAHTKSRKEKDPHAPWVRQKPIDIVRNELQAITDYNRKMKFLCVMENDFTCRDVRTLKEYCENIQNICKVPFYTMVSPNTLNEIKLKIMIENGLEEINMGIQTNGDFNRQYYDRNVSDALIQEKVVLINSYKDKVYPFYDFIIFNPEEPEESLRKTLSLLKKFPLPFDLVSHHLTLGTETLLYKRLISENKICSDEVKKTNSSDFHNFKFNDYNKWDTFYLNLFLEWIAGPHNGEWIGRVPRNIDMLRKTAFGVCFFGNKKIKPIEIDQDDDVFTLFTEISFDVLNAPENRDFLRELNELLPPLRYTNQT